MYSNLICENKKYSSKGALLLKFSIKNAVNVTIEIFNKMNVPKNNERCIQNNERCIQSLCSTTLKLQGLKPYIE